jgi:spoIIIJ-associated protein
VSDAKEEFQGKNLDEAIEAACKHYDLKRDKLEIEILSGGSSGIFGLVGVKKATVRAKPRGSLKSLVEDQPVAEPKPERAEKPRREERPRQEDRPARREPEARPAPAAQAEAAQPGQPAAQAAAGEGQEARRSERGRRGRGRGRGERQPERGDRQPESIGNRPPEAQPESIGNRPAEERPEPNGNRMPEVRPLPPDRDGNRDPNRDFSRDSSRSESGRGRGRGRDSDRPRRDSGDARPPRRDAQPGDLGSEDENGAPQGIGHLDQALLEQVAREVTQKLLLPLVENAKIEVTLLSDRVSVRIEDPENSGLLIGREGQTLASIQYLVNRLVSKRMDASVRVQIDAGDYRENQDERLRQIARHLADKAMSSGRTQSTRPMSSYHRRVVHLTLQDDEHVFTRSKGEGSMKRVLIMTKRKGKNGELLEDGPAGQSDQEEQTFQEHDGTAVE